MSGSHRWTSSTVTSRKLEPKQLYGVAVSPDLISRVTDAVLEEVRERQNRPLDPVYPVVFFDALRVKIRDEGLVRNKAVYLALAITSEGDKEVLGLWIEQTEGAKFWLKVMNEIRTRGLQDILIAVVDGLTGFPDAIGTVFPAHYGPDLHRASDPQLAGVRLLEGSQKGHARPQSGLPGRDGRSRGDPARRVRSPLGPALPGGGPRLAARLGACGADVRLSTGHPQDDLYHQRPGEPEPVVAQDHQDPGKFPSDEAAAKLLFLALRNAGVRWRRPIDWIAAMGQFAILFEDLFPAAAR